MARGPKKTQSKAKATAEARSNLTEETFLTHFNEYSGLKRALDEASSALRNMVKRAKGEGINEKMLARVFRERRIEPDKVNADERDLARYRRWLRMPIGAQADMFANDDEGGDAPPVGDDKPYDDGYFAGSEGKGLPDNPHTADTPESQRWIQGWYDAQAKIAGRMNPDKDAA